MGNLFTDLFSTKPAEEAAKAKAAGYTAGNTAAQDALTQGQTGADALYGQAYAPYTSLIDSTGRGATAYGMRQEQTARQDSRLQKTCSRRRRATSPGSIS
jgi:3-deoxy-D-arabino-heptulosonate 7-phosphate (DAHP) synthase